MGRRVGEKESRREGGKEGKSEGRSGGRSEGRKLFEMKGDEKGKIIDYGKAKVDLDTLSY